MATTKFIPGTVVASSWTNDVDRQTYTTLSGVTGTNTLVGVGPNSITTLTTGQLFYFNPQNTNSGAVTINITCNGVALGAKNILKYNGIALVAQDLVAGCEAELYYDGTSFQLLNPQNPNLNTVNQLSPGRLIGVQTITATGTYTPTTGTTSIVVEAVGSGGGGGGTGVTTAGQVAAAGGGGAGNLLKARYTTGFTPTVAVTIGSGGAGGGVNTVGTTGADCVFGALMTVKGGTGGGAGGGGPVTGTGGGASVAGSTGGNIYSLPSATGSGAGASFAAGVIISGAGASSPYGAGGGAQITSTAGNQAGVAATGRGSGGGGAASGAGQGGAGGGAGSAGMFIVYEYA